MEMDSSGVSSHNVGQTTLAKRRVVVFSVCFISVVAFLVWCAPRIDFEILRFRTKASIAEMSVSGEEVAFSLNEKQTQELLTVINRRTHPTILRKAVLYNDWIDVRCKNGRGECLRRIYIHQAYDTESMDVLEELFAISRRGVQENRESDAGACEAMSPSEREY